MFLALYLLVGFTMCLSCAAVIMADDDEAKVRWPWLIFLSVVWPSTLLALTVMVLAVSVQEAFNSKKRKVAHR